jgi:hypothetical protein
MSDALPPSTCPDNVEGIVRLMQCHRAS